jgi:hypothetical protein
MTETELLEEASYAWDDGRRSESLQLMRAAIGDDPSLLALRRALAERYRQMGNPDQAGRWGIVFDGWTTSIERDRLARLLAASGVPEAHTAKFLSLPDDPLPQVVKDLLRGPVSTYRTKFETNEWERSSGAKSEGFDLVVPTIIAWVLYVVSSIVGAYTILGFTIFGTTSSIMARTFVLTTSGFLTLASATSIAMAAQLKSRRWTIAWLVFTIGVGGLTYFHVANGFIYR